MSAETLRRAASLMRKNTEDTSPSPWSGIDGHIDFYSAHVSGSNRTAVATTYCNTDAHHIASWHPAVALAVADLLDRAADDHDETPCPAVDAAFAVARAYLGESA